MWIPRESLVFGMEETCGVNITVKDDIAKRAEDRRFVSTVASELSARSVGGVPSASTAVSARRVKNAVALKFVFMEE